jgi:large subunit ribosomal protein L23
MESRIMKREKHFDIIKRPLLTEKSSALTSGNADEGYAFEVKLDATKGEIKDAVESIFGVKVVSVNTVVVSGKVKRVGRVLGRRSTWKKAYIKLKEGDKISLVEGV